jgi:predicted PurR-regulated permease PerM
LELARDYPELEKYASDIVGAISSKLNEWFTTDVLMAISQYIGYITSGVISVVTTAMDIVVGLIVAVYALYSKDTFSGQGKKIIYAIFEPDKGNVIFETFRKSHQIFGGFIIGKIVDSAIIGVLAFVGLSALNMPYTLLLSVIIGVTNVIPFFGPFIGAIPCAFLILLVNPMQAVYFGLFILALQQLDGNVIGPHILGDTVGISGFWVRVSITVAGGLFGFAGMLLGVPVFAVLYMLVSDFVSSKLKGKGRPMETGLYQTIRNVEDLELEGQMSMEEN